MEICSWVIFSFNLKNLNVAIFDNIKILSHEKCIISFDLKNDSYKIISFFGGF